MMSKRKPQKSHFQAKSLQRRPAVVDFYGTGIEIGAGLGRLAVLKKKKIPADCDQLVGQFFQVLMGKKNN